LFLQKLILDLVKYEKFTFVKFYSKSIFVNNNNDNNYNNNNNNVQSTL